MLGRMSTREKRPDGQESSDHTDEDSDKEALLGLPEGFDLVLPDILPVDEEE